MKSNKGCFQPSSKNKLFTGVWFREVKTVEEGNAEKLDYLLYVNTSCKVFFLATLEKLIKEWLGGSHLVMNSSRIVTYNRKLMPKGYKYKSQKVLFFISKEGGRSTKPGVTYLSSYPDNYFIISICPFFP